MFRFFCIILCFGFVTLSGCSETARVDREYQTVKQNLGHNPEAARHLHELGVTLLNEGKYDAAETAFKRALELDVNFGPSHNGLGTLYYEQHKLYLAAWEFQYAIKLMPDTTEPINNLGLVHEEAGRLDEAVKYYQDALKLDPKNTEVIGNLVRAELRRGDRTPEIQEQLKQLTINDVRPEWRSWAQEELARLQNP